MAGKDYSDQSLEEFNPYYAQFYKNSDKNKGKDKDKNQKKASKSNSVANSRNLLRRSENASLSKQGQKFNSDSNPTWSNKTSGKAAPTSTKQKITFSKKHKVATFIIITLLGLGGFLIGSSNALLPPALNALYTSNTNSAYAGYTTHSVKLQSYMIRNLNEATTNRIWLNRYRHMSNSFRNRLAQNNIEVDGTGRNAKLKWTQVDADGVTHTMDIGANDFKRVYLENPDFRDAYSTAKRSRIVTFFDNVANRVYSKLGLSRNGLKNYRSTGNAETDAENFRNHMSSQYDNETSSIRNRGKVEIDDVDSEGKPIKIEEMRNEGIANSNTSDADPTIKAKGYISDVSQKAAAGANGICALLKIGNAISLTASAMETANSIKAFMNIMENVSKMMAGEGDGTAINAAMNFFVTPETTEVTQYTAGVNLENFDPNNIDGYSGGDSTIATKTVTGAPIEAQGAQLVMSGSPVNSEVSNYSLERTSSAITRALRINTATIQACNVVQAGSAIISLVTTISTLGVSTIVDFGINIIANVGINAAASAILGFLVPTIAKLLFTNVFESVTGVSMGELFTMGAAASNFRIGRSGSGQVAASKEEVIKYNQTVKQVAALDAEVDRLNLSPFDASSPNTFLGSIAYSLLPLTTSRTATSIGTLMRTTSKSLASITGIARADDASDGYMTTFGNDLGSCPSLDSQGIACDIYGNPIPISVNLEIEPDDPGYVEFLNENLNPDGSIKENETLAKFIVSNVERESPLGVIDTNILANFEVGNDLTNSIPIVDDVVDIWNAAQDAVNLGWATGENTYYTSDNDLAEDIAYASTFVQDQRILDQMADDSYENPVTAFLDKYEAEHPLDNSFSGYIARITGLPKETAETVIAMAEYYQFLDSYNVDTRIAMDSETTKLKSGDTVVAEISGERFNFDESSKYSEDLTLISQNIIYADVRNRSYAA